jgi:hypothetical protein
MTYSITMEFIESPLFTRLVYNYISDHEYGVLIPQSGGLRKIRVAMKNCGKSGGARFIYYFKKSQSEIWLLTIYTKNEVENLPIKALKALAKELLHDNKP